MLLVGIAVVLVYSGTLHPLALHGSLQVAACVVASGDLLIC